MKKLLYFGLLVFALFVLHDCMVTHSKTFYIPAIQLYVKVTTNYHTDISYLYLSYNKEFGDNYIKFESLDKRYPDIPLHLVNNKLIEVYTNEFGINKIKEIKSSSKIYYTSNDSINYWEFKNLPLVIVYGRGRHVIFINKGRKNEKVIEL